MAKFLTPLRTEKLDGYARRWILTDHLVFESTKYRGRFICPAGCQTDLASIPRLGWVLFPKVGKQDKGAVVHDLGYTHQLVTEHGERIHTVKHVADQLFLEGMLAEGVNGFSARVMFGMVSAFGNPEAHPLAAHRMTHTAPGIALVHPWLAMANELVDYDRERGLWIGPADPFLVRGLAA